MKGFLIVPIVAALLSGASLDPKVRQQNRAVVEAAAKALNEGLPKRVDSYTQLLKVVGEGERLIYVFEVDGKGRSDEELLKKKERIRRNVTRGLCHGSARFLKSGIVLVYRYVSKATGKTLFDVVVARRDCPMLRE